MQLGADDSLVKPFEPEVLLSPLRAVVEPTAQAAA
jgi:DNA-binding response OmpR family regulator